MTLKSDDVFHSRVMSTMRNPWRPQYKTATSVQSPIPDNGFRLGGMLYPWLKTLCEFRFEIRMKLLVCNKYLTCSSSTWLSTASTLSRTSFLREHLLSTGARLNAWPTKTRRILPQGQSGCAKYTHGRHSREKNFHKAPTDHPAFPPLTRRGYIS